MATQTLKVHLRFDHDEFQWLATINGQRYAAHRFESRTFELAKMAYLEQNRLGPGKTVEFVMDLEWPTQMRMAEAELQKARATYELALEAYERLQGQFIAGWIDHGLSMKGAREMVGIAKNTAWRVIQLSGDLASAAKSLWKLVPPAPENGAIGRASIRTNSKYAKADTVEDGDD